MVWCGRVSDGASQSNAGGQFLHRLSDGLHAHFPAFSIPKPPLRKTAPPKQNWPAEAERFAKDADKYRQTLAAQLGVSAGALEALGVGWDSLRSRWTFPERDATGQIIGLVTRRRNGAKKHELGSRAGLTYALDWNAGDGPILLVEGGSDTAALMTIGLNVVGRPSNYGGVDHLSGLLANVPHDRSVIVIGERDEKPDGRWPGRDGAIGTAKPLAERIDRPIAWGLPPDEAKDSRSWLNAMPKLPVDRLADLFISGLDTTVINPPIVIYPEKPIVPRISIDDWREEMLQARLRSLGCPGVYVDTSTTGAGKSYVDHIVIVRDFGLGGRNMKALSLLPTHANCDEAVKPYLTSGVNAACYPPRISTDIGERPQNCWNGEANRAESIGLPVVKSVCPACEHRPLCLTSGYLAQLLLVTNADVAIATHKRAENAGLSELAKGRDYLSIQENAVPLLRPSVDISTGDVIQARHLIQDYILNDPASLNWFGDATRVDDEGNRYQDAELAIRERPLFFANWRHSYREADETYYKAPPVDSHEVLAAIFRGTPVSKTTKSPAERSEAIRILRLVIDCHLLYLEEYDLEGNLLSSATDEYPALSFDRIIIDRVVDELNGISDPNEIVEIWGPILGLGVAAPRYVEYLISKWLWACLSSDEVPSDFEPKWRSLLEFCSNHPNWSYAEADSDAANLWAHLIGIDDSAFQFWRPEHKGIADRAADLIESKLELVVKDARTAGPALRWMSRGVGDKYRFFALTWTSDVIDGLLNQNAPEDQLTLSMAEFLSQLWEENQVDILSSQLKTGAFRRALRATAGSGCELAVDLEQRIGGQAK